MKSAIDSKSAAEFADSVMRVTLDEAKANGANDAELEALKMKFESARKLINDNGS